MGAVKRVKNVEWEKNRRERLNLTFFELSRLLPDHDPTLTLTKLEILNKSIIYIKELKERNVSLLGTNQSEVLEAEMTSLRDQVTELQRRNQQLAELLQTAKISLPPRPLPHSTPLTCPRKWAGKLSPNTVTGVKNSAKKKGETKENPVNLVPLSKLSTKKKSVKMKKNIKTKEIKHSQTKISKSVGLASNSSNNPLREFNNALGVQSVSATSEAAVVNSSSAPLREFNSASSIQITSQSSQTNIKRTSVSHSDVKGTAVPAACKSVPNPSVGSTSVQNTLVLSRTVTLPCTTISLVLSNSKAGIVTVAKSNVLPAPIMATGIQPVLQCNPSLSSLGPGTLIMPGGRIVPVPPPPTVLAPTLILLPTTTTTVAVTTTRPSQKPASSLRPIVPKPRQRDITKTTFANKVPIPATSTYRQGLCSGPKPPHNNHHVPLDTEKKLKKKSIVNKQSVREKCSPTESTVSKSQLLLSDVSAEKILESHSNKIDTGKCPDTINALKKSKQLGQCVPKRKCETTNENIKDNVPKVAKIDAKSVEIISPCADSNTSRQECNRYANGATLQKCPTDIDSVKKLESSKGPENVSKQREIHRNEKCNIIQEINKSPSAVENVATTEGVPSNIETAVGNQNSVDKNNLTSKRKTNIITTSGSANCDSSVFCSSQKTLQNTVVDNRNAEKAVEKNDCLKNNSTVNSQISKEDNHTVNSGAHIIKPSSCLIADTTLSTEGLNFSKVGQQISQTNVDDHSVTGEKHCDLIQTASIDVSNIHKDNCINKSAQNTNDNIIVSTDNQQTPQPNLKDNTKQKSENLAVNDVYLKDKSQQVNAPLSISSSTSKVADSSTQVCLNFGVKSNQGDEVLNQNSHTNRLHFNNGDPLVFKTSVNVNSIEKDQIQVLNVNQNNNKNESRSQTPVGDCFGRDNCNLDMHFNNARQISNVDTSNILGNKSQMLPDDRLHLGVKGNLLSQSVYKDNKYKNTTMSAVRVFSGEPGNILNINCIGNEGCQNPSTTSNMFPSSDQQNLSVNIYTNERKESLNNAQFNGNKGSSSNLTTMPRANNVQDPPNSGNNSFNSQQTTHHSCLDSVPSKNNSTLYSERFHFSEGVQQSVLNKTVPVSTNQTNISFNFQNIQTNNNMKVVSDINVQTNNSGNFYTSGNHQKQQNENINVLGNRPQNTVPVSGNFNLIKTHPCSDPNTSSKISVSLSSTNQIHFINTQKQNPITNNSLSSNNGTQNVTDRTFLVSDQSKHITKTNSNSSAQDLNSGIGLRGSNQHHVNVSVNVSKNTNFQNQQEVSKDSNLSSKFHPEAIKTSVSQSCKSTQVTSLQLSFADGEKNIVESKQQAKQNTVNSGSKKPVDELKPMCESKSLIQDDSQELTSLFPTEKLQSCSESLFRDTCAEFRDRNLFLPVSHSYMDEMRLNLPHSDFSNDLLSSLQVPSSGQHPESISPTAAFLLAFPLVSTSKTSELITENDGGESQHATPTTILQIGNIEPSSSELFHQTALMMENNPNMMKQSKHTDPRKDNSSKQLKDIENFNKFQQMEINELMRNENFSLNNCKEKKNFVALGEQDIFYPCTKKKSNGKTSNYQMPPTIVPHVQNKAFEFSESNLRSNPEQDRQLNHNEKKNQAQTESGTSSQNIYNSSSQPYTYSSFSSGNEFMMPSSNYLSSNNQPGTESSKPPLSSMPSSNFNVISWTTASITSNASQLDYTTPYCSYPQKPYSNTNEIKVQKNVQTNFEVQKVKDKSISNLNPLPKFSNFQFNNSHSNQDLHGYTQSAQTDITNYKPESKTKKLKTGSQRAPVNWMTAPDVRPLPDAGVAPVLPDVMFQHQKELDFPSAPNNMMMLNNSSNITPFNISTSTSNNSQTFYPNSHFSGVDLQLDFAPFPDISTSKPLRNSTNVPNSQQNPHHYSWSPSKSSIPLMPHIDSHMIPSTLPTLVGDLALGTTTPSGPVDTFRNLSMPTTPFNIETPVKKYEKKQETQKPAAKINEKDCFPNSERRNNRTVPEYCQKTHTHQSTNTSSSFLSVSQLVDHVKTEQSPTSRRTTKPSGTKVNNTVQKRNTSNQQSDKSKVPNNINNHNNYHNSNPGMMSQKKFDAHSGVYQEVHNTGVGFPGTFANQGGPMPWQSEKPLRSTTHYKGSYSAESLIADQSTPAQGHVSELPQFPNQYNHPPVVSSASYPSTDFSHQNVQPLEFHQTHQNCFNFPSNSHYSSASFNPDGDYHLGLDHLFNFNPASNKHSTSCQTSTKDNRSSGKRGQNKQRREEFTPQWTPQVYPTSMRPKGPLPPHCPPSTSSPSHQGTTTLTNFNLSTIFPEINDKVGMTGPPPPSNFPPAPNFQPH